jgi:AcrR family transcriptional regulator
MLVAFMSAPVSKAIPDCNAYRVRNLRGGHSASTGKSLYVRYPRAVAHLAFQRARTEEQKRQRAAAIVEAARGLALERGVASVTLTEVASRAGVHYSAVRRYYTSHKEVLLHLAAECWVRWSDAVCAALREPGPMLPSRVAETLANGLAADPLFCDLLASLHLHLEHEANLERVVEIRRTSAAAVMSLADAIEQALPALGRSGALNVLLAAYSLAAPLWQIAHPPQRLIDALAEEPAVPSDWNLDFASALTRLLTATCVGLLSESTERNHI